MFPYKNIILFVIFPRESKMKQNKTIWPKNNVCVFVSMVIVPVYWLLYVC